MTKELNGFDVRIEELGMGNGKNEEGCKPGYRSSLNLNPNGLAPQGQATPQRRDLEHSHEDHASDSSQRDLCGSERGSTVWADGGWGGSRGRLGSSQASRGSSRESDNGGRSGGVEARRVGHCRGCDNPLKRDRLGQSHGRSRGTCRLGNCQKGQKRNGCYG